MPATYAHYRFGHQVLSRLPESIRDVILSEEELFDAGLHGPDILFYYNPLEDNLVSIKGHEMHRESGMIFFKKAAKVLAEHDDRAHLAYVYGFLCHFALDRSCHGYIGKAVKQRGVSHTEIEREFDRRLLVMDGYDPTARSLTDHLHGRSRNAAVISDFYPGISKRQIRRTICLFVICNRLLLAPGRIKRRLLEKTLALLHHEEVMKMVISKKPNPQCFASNMEIGRLYLAAVPQAVDLICGFWDCASGKRPWDDLYHYNFSSAYRGEEKKG